MPFNVLFLCTGNSARSILAEAAINHLAIGGGKFKGYSAGSHAKGAIHPLTLEILRQYHLPTEGLRSKSWSEFTLPDAPRLDFVFTVCDQAAAEPCPTVARSADDGALGRAGSGSGAGHRRGSAASLS